MALWIQTQSFCNGRCSICPYRIVSKKLEQGRMEWELFKKIVDEAVSEPLLSSVVFELHNEPLLDERIFDWVKYTKSVGPNKFVLIISNGELVDRFDPNDIVQSNVNTLFISLNANSRETYESINNGLDYDKVMNNLSSLLANEATRQKTGVGFVVTEQNAHEVYQATKYWKKQGVKTKLVEELSNRGGTLDTYGKFKLKTGYRGTPFLTRVRQYFANVMTQVLGCHLPFYQMLILFNGDAILCTEDWNRATVGGNVKTSSLREIWNSKKMNETRRLLLRKRYEEIGACQKCSLVRRG